MEFTWRELFVLTWLFSIEHPEPPHDAGVGGPLSPANLTPPGRGAPGRMVPPGPGAPIGPRARCEAARDRRTAAATRETTCETARNPLEFRVTLPGRRPGVHPP